MAGQAHTNQEKGGEIVPVRRGRHAGERLPGEPGQRRGTRVGLFHHLPAGERRELPLVARPHAGRDSQGAVRQGGRAGAGGTRTRQVRGVRLPIPGIGLHVHPAAGQEVPGVAVLRRRQAGVRDAEENPRP